jgi:hypothetical protein
MHHVHTAFWGYNTYQDVHERNILFEIGERGRYGAPAIVRDWKGRVRAVKVSLQPVDVR